LVAEVMPSEKTCKVCLVFGGKGCKKGMVHRGHCSHCGLPKQGEVAML
jgi:hypothetical protein